MIVHTSAIVFKTVDYRESSKIVTLFTKEHGKIAVIAKGSKKPKNKLSGLMEVGNILDVIYYHKASRSVQILTEASYLETLAGLRTDFEKMATATSAIELIGQLLHEHEVNHPVFQFTHNFLLWLNQTKNPPQKIFPYLQIRLAGLMGLGLQLQGNGSTTDSQHYLSIESGLISEESGTDSTSYKLSQNQMLYVHYSLDAKGAKVFDIEFGTGELKELVRLFDRYLKYHVEGLRDRKSDAIFDQILQD